MSSLLLKGGRLIDGEGVRDRDILICDGRVNQILLPGESPVAVETFDLDGDFISAGFIDSHTHIISHTNAGTARVSADAIGVEQGVTCVVDAGSGGHNNIAAFKQAVIDTQHTGCFALINIASDGIVHIPGGHAGSPERVSLSGTVAAIEAHPDWIKGVKVLASNTHTGAFGIEAVKIARKAAELTNTPLMVHIGNPPPIIDDVLDLLRPGDLLTHAYHGKTGGVLGYADRVIPAFVEAVERGIFVDLGHGQSSFSFSTCEAALQQGMPVHIISSDLHRASLRGRARSLSRTMSKLRLLGLELTDVIRAVTETPALALGLEKFGFGAIAENQPAHLTVFQETRESHWVEDAEGERRQTDSWIQPLMTIIHGKVQRVTGDL